MHSRITRQATRTGGRGVYFQWGKNQAELNGTDLENPDVEEAALNALTDGRARGYSLRILMLQSSLEACVCSDERMRTWVDKVKAEMTYTEH